MEVLINVYSFGGSFNKHLKTPSEKKELIDLLFKVNFGTSMVRLHSKIVLVFRSYKCDFCAPE